MPRGQGQPWSLGLVPPRCSTYTLETGQPSNPHGSQPSATRPTPQLPGTMHRLHQELLSPPPSSTRDTGTQSIQPKLLRAQASPSPPPQHPTSEEIRCSHALQPRLPATSSRASPASPQTTSSPGALHPPLPPSYPTCCSRAPGVHQGRWQYSPLWMSQQDAVNSHTIPASCRAQRCHQGGAGAGLCPWWPTEGVSMSEEQGHAPKTPPPGNSQNRDRTWVTRGKRPSR